MDNFPSFVTKSYSEYILIHLKIYRFFFFWCTPDIKINFCQLGYAQEQSVC